MALEVHRFVQNACNGDHLTLISLIQAKQDHMSSASPAAPDVQCVETSVNIGAAAHSRGAWPVSQCLQCG